MSYNGSGVAQINSTGQPVSASTLIEASVFNAFTADVATMLSTAICKDGQTTVTANLPMATFRHTGVGNASARTDYAAAGQVQDGKLNWVDGGGTADAITATYSPAITALVDGQLCCVRATAANATTTPTFAPNGLTARTIVRRGGGALVAGSIAGDGHELILRYDLANTRWEFLNSQSVIGTDVQAYDADIPTVSASQGEMEAGTEAALRSMSPLRVAQAIAALASGAQYAYISGLGMSTAGSSATMTIAAGQATDSTNVVGMSRSAALAKTTAAWAAGTAAGGLDTGSIANSTWYHFYLIAKADKTTDFLISTSVSAPTMPSGYVYFRRIGSAKTNGSAQWTKFTQVGNEFYWDTPAAADFNGAGSATAALLTCNVPTGVAVKGFFNTYVNSGGGGVQYLYISDPSNADVAPTIPATPGASLGFNGAASQQIAGQCVCWTNTSAQIRHRENNTNTVSINTLGWLDPRGQV